MELHALSNDDGKDARDANELQSILDDALAELPDVDRDAVLLRYFAKKSFAEIGTAIQSSEDAAQKRLSRALDKMRDFFRGRGVGASAGAVIAALGVAGTQAAPCGFATTVATASLAAAGISLGSVSILQTIALMKTKIAIACVIAAGVVVPTMIQQKTVSQLREQNAALQQQLAQINTRVEDTAALSVAPLDEGQLERQNNEHTELLQLRGEVGRLRKQSATQSANLETERDRLAFATKIRIETINSMKQLGLAARLFAGDNNHKNPATFEEMESYLSVTDTNRYEFVKHIREVSEAEPQLILFREIEPRQLPDGSWERVYTFADGSVQTKRSPNGDFSAFEQEHMAKPLTAE